MINNKNSFFIYSIVRLILYVIVGLMFVLINIPLIYNTKWNLFHILVSKYGFVSLFVLIGFFIVFVIFALYEYVIRPSYVEMKIDEREIVIRIFSSNIKNWISILLIFRYKRYLKELKINKQEYNNYKLQIDKLGFRKLLILQKINKDGLFETSAINISLFRLKKYTNMILSIDRLQGKLNLN